ncbi:rfaE bifunctional protein [Caldimicrobium thiodismutans]|uniref:D-glycero-beta-D-manno-heptose 1-phosphate adenylyltransferase n=1 Tax=Caldimicrobium thiodismutans TaxID=1653476 RepID=A0A0U4W2C2_9BACT|nr:D-glycero-beta-D-manno-heptose 1-phosphate adenylyltransferase [Caldimicrobium thiodismutans]BAU23229.1 rfaE bifunctional protein [Caldimicrobium thiodismutans]
MKSPLNFSIAQMEVTQNLEKNLEKILEFIKKAKGDIILFPELALTGYRNFQELSPDTVEVALREIQRSTGDKKIFLGSVFFKKDGYVNAYLALSSSGVSCLAEKELLFPGLDDLYYLKPGQRKGCLFLNSTTWIIAICFELRSPELVRGFLSEGLDGLIVPAQWPKLRIDHFKTLLKARALENQIHSIGINGVGKIGELELGGGSHVFSPSGEELGSCGDEETLLELTLDLKTQPLPYPLRTPFLKTSKLKTLDELKEIISKRRSKGQVMVFTNGCFDLLHAGHVDYLQKARHLGDFLVVGLNSDVSIQKIKGPERPINHQAYRVEVLSALACVDYIILFDEETPERLIHTLKPDILVKGEDWPEDKIVGGAFVKGYGGKVIRLPFNYNTSTSKLIEKIRSKGI